ncbi:methyl-accepting chemotaxis protein [Paraburkholderia caribensis]|uniref:methyl-accepting chemotaxis protein n=1 Tax=Paraburkholderia caribensis TaxID=75105 RepID=UPI000720C8CA|nr:methyl-accepting chemotaxis protein [Paraburkholderia caribensis]ALP66234.1 chemotaxis protein [Paraburkholderia caribensis]AUT54834.1 chemotaxis protein [Paraburkholderia caribensis]
MKLSFSQKLWLSLVLSLSCLTGIYIRDAFQTRRIQMEERKDDLMHATEIALGVVKALAAESASATMPEAQAKAKALEILRNSRYGEDGYFTILDSRPVILMHPIHPEMNGKDASGYRDPDGAYVFRDFVHAVGPRGNGFTEFSFPRPGAREASRKISYQLRYAPWDWIISTGLYVDDIDTEFRAALYRSLGWLVVAAALLSAAVVVLNRNLMRSLGGEPSYAAEIADRIASNDLTAVVNVARGDSSSLLFSMRRMQAELTGTIRTISRSSDAIASSAHQLAAGNRDLSQRTEEQAASLEETAASMEQLTATVTQNAENSNQASRLAEEAMRAAEHAGSIVDQVVGTMNEINADSGKMATIVDIIEDIAFQTNILALNAAVEAARAGALGRGFAVVASEVRSLAQRSSGASKEIRELISDSVHRVQTGTRYVQQAGSAMSGITTEVKRVTGIMTEIASASQEQSKGIGQVSEAVTQMDKVTQQNAAMVEEAAAASRSLESLAHDLNAAISMFKL